METHFVKIESADKMTPDMLRIVTGKPAGYYFKSAQVKEMTIN